MVGKQIQATRKLRKITLEQLAERVGVSKGHLSQIERGQADPSLSALRKISEELNIPIHTLFNQDSLSQSVTYLPRSNRTHITFGEANLTFERISSSRELYARDTAFDVFACNALPRSTAAADLLARNCEELIYVVAGELAYHAGDESVTLQAGDSIFVPDNTGHSFSNPGMDMVELLCVLAPNRREGSADSQQALAAPIVPLEASWNVTGEKIRKLRMEKNLKINDFAEQLGISSTHVSRMERDLIEPSLSVLRKVASVLEVSIPDLLSSSFPTDIVVTTPENRRKFQFTNQDGSVSHCFCTPNVLSGGQKPTISVYLSELDAKQWDSHEYALHEQKDEIIVLLEGNTEVSTVDNGHVLSRGDGVLIVRGTPHRLYNPGVCKAVFLGVLAK